MLFEIEDMEDKFSSFEITFFLNNFNIDIILRILFLIFNHVKCQFSEARDLLVNLHSYKDHFNYKIP